MKLNSLKRAINDALNGVQSGMFAQRCEFYAVKLPIWENDTWEVSIFRCVNGIFASQNKWSKTTGVFNRNKTFSSRSDP